MNVIEKSLEFFVKFMVNGDEVYAYFPFSKEIGGNKTCYAHIGQHSVCCKEYIAESRIATVAEYNDLYLELLSIGYGLRVYRENLISFKDIIDKKIAVKCVTKEDAHHFLMEIGRANYREQFRTDRAGLSDIFEVFYRCWDPSHADTYHFISEETEYDDKIGYSKEGYYKREGYTVINSNLVIK